MSGYRGIIKEADELMEEIKDDNTPDATMIAAVQAVKHYEIARYGTLVSWASELGMSEAASILCETLEEKATDQKLTALGKSRINAMAIDGDDAGKASDGKMKSVKKPTLKLPASK